MIDFNKKLKVHFSLNWAPECKATPSLETLLEDLVQRGDRQQVYLARLDFKLK
jgi:hypothetical protein